MQQVEQALAYEFTQLAALVLGKRHAVRKVGEAPCNCTGEVDISLPNGDLHGQRDSLRFGRRNVDERVAKSVPVRWAAEALPDCGLEG